MLKDVLIEERANANYAKWETFELFAEKANILIEPVEPARVAEKNIEEKRGLHCHSAVVRASNERCVRVCAVVTIELKGQTSADGHCKSPARHGDVTSSSITRYLHSSA
jgi:hypothetical protein